MYSAAVLSRHGTCSCLFARQDVKCVAWHPSRELLASCSYDDSIRLWVCDEGDWVCAAVLEGGLAHFRAAGTLTHSQ
jgi:WD40 repeat protein